MEVWRWWPYKGGLRSTSRLCFGRVCALGVTPRGEAFCGLVALSARPRVANCSRGAGNGAVGGATSKGSGGGLELRLKEGEGVATVKGTATALPDGGEGTAVETQCVVSPSVPAFPQNANNERVVDPSCQPGGCNFGTGTYRYSSYPILQTPSNIAPG